MYICVHLSVCVSVCVHCAAPPFLVPVYSSVQFMEYGDQLEVKCSVVGSLPLAYVWTHKELPPHKYNCTEGGHVITRSGSLFFAHMTCEDEGRWVCMASNDVGEVLYRVDIYRKTSGSE